MNTTRNLSIVAWNNFPILISNVTIYLDKTRKVVTINLTIFTPRQGHNPNSICAFNYKRTQKNKWKNWILIYYFIEIFIYLVTINDMSSKLDFFWVMWIECNPNDLMNKFAIWSFLKMYTNFIFPFKKNNNVLMFHMGDCTLSSSFFGVTRGYIQKIKNHNKCNRCLVFMFQCQKLY
jgi:hypothetical protein